MNVNANFQADDLAQSAGGGDHICDWYCLCGGGLSKGVLGQDPLRLWTLAAVHDFPGDVYLPEIAGAFQPAKYSPCLRITGAEDSELGGSSLGARELRCAGADCRVQPKESEPSRKVCCVRLAVRLSHLLLLRVWADFCSE